MLETYQRHGRARLAATIISVIVIAGIVVLADHLKSKGAAVSGTTTQNTQTAVSSNSGITTPNAPTSSTGTTGSTASNSTTDGTYNASSNYLVPDGDQSIQVSVTLKDGVVTGASVQNSESDPTSASFHCFLPASASSSSASNSPSTILPRPS